jgi:hypothetical protein
MKKGHLIGLGLGEHSIVGSEHDEEIHCGLRGGSSWQSRPQFVRDGCQQLNEGYHLAFRKMRERKESKEAGKREEIKRETEEEGDGERENSLLSC